MVIYFKTHLQPYENVQSTQFCLKFVQGRLSSICQIFRLLESYHLPSAQPTGDKISIQVVK